LSLTTPTPLGAQKEVSNLISVIRATPDGGSVKLDVLRNGQNKDVIIEPKSNESNGPKTIGVMLSPNFLAVQRIKADSIVQATQLATRQLVETSTQTLNGFGQIFSMILSGKGAAAGQSFSGPIGLIKTGSEVVSTQDFTTVLLFAAAISINLGVVNALPLPALDGGQLAFVIAEAVTGRKVDQRFQEGITSVAILLLLLFTVKTAFGDVESILGR
jgi:RIP metalloprotease RseP